MALSSAPAQPGGGMPVPDPELRNPYVGRGAEGCLRSAQIDQEERDTLPWDSPRRELLDRSAALWRMQAAVHQLLDAVTELAIQVDERARALDRAGEVLAHHHNYLAGLTGHDRCIVCTIRAEPEAGTPDPRPPDTEGLGYIGADCRAGAHERCPGYWAADPEITGRAGRGSRCACDCHQEGAPDV